MAVKEVVSLIFLIYILSVSSRSINFMETNYLDVPVDHFVTMDEAKYFKIRYLVDNQFHVKGGPIFVYLGHQEDVNVFPRNTGFLYNIAVEFKALIVFIEHRYYGESLPFGDDTFKSSKNMRYLSTMQALGDFAIVINHLKEKYFESKTEGYYPIIVFGGGYGGNLAAWLRLKYPFLVKGAISSSASLMYQKDGTDCGKFYEKVSEVFHEYGHGSCVRNIQLKWAVIKNVSGTKLGRELLSTSFKLCNPIRDDDDLDKFINWLTNVYVDLASYNYHVPTEYFNPLPAFPVKVFCDKISSSSLETMKELFENFGNALEIYTNYTGQTNCNNIDKFIETPAKYAWAYQTCTELVTPKCSTDSDMFINHRWSFDKLKLDCFKYFGFQNTSIDNPLLTYGGLNLKYFSNIVFTNGLSDPWSVNGILVNVSSQVSVFNIVKGPHHLDLRGYDSADNHFVLKARQNHINAIKKWLNE